MPRGSALSEREKGKIDAFWSQGISKREIARQIGRSDRVVRNYVADRENYGSRSYPGRKRILQERDVRRICRTASNSTISISSIKRKCDLSASVPTIWRAIKNSPNIMREYMQKAPRLDPRHKVARLAFARDHITQDWNKVIFSDEKKFNLDGPDSLNGYWRDLRKEPRYFSKRNFGGGSVMVWGGFSSHGTVDLAFPSCRMNSIEYQDVLQAKLLPYLRQIPENRLTFQQDNARIHVSASTKAWFSNHNIDLMDWPARSPDANPIENVWGWLVRKVYADNRQFNNVEELKAAIKNAWSLLTNEVLTPYIESMPRRIIAIVENNGGQINY